MSSIFNDLLGVVNGCHHPFFVTGASSKDVAVDPNATLPLQECDFIKMVMRHSMLRSTQYLKIQSIVRPLDQILFESRHFTESRTEIVFAIAHSVLKQYIKQATQNLFI